MKRVMLVVAVVGLGCGRGNGKSPPEKDGGAGGIAGGAGGIAGGAGAGDAGGGGTGGALDAAAGGAGGGGGGVGGVGGAADAAAGGAGGDPNCHTSVSGVVYDPSGNVPLYNVLVYAPSGAVPPLVEGISCPLSCDAAAAAHPIAAALTDTTGTFHLDGVPGGVPFSMVIQVGKWRRTVQVPAVTACASTPLTDHELTRLPRKQSEGHLPQIAVVTGHASALECLLRDIGIADEEFTNDTGSGRVHLYVGGAGRIPDEGAATLASGAALADAYTALFPDPTKLARYDALLLECEGERLDDAKAPYFANMKGYADGGGRVIVEHLQLSWIQRGPDPWPSMATWIGIGPDPSSPSTDLVNVTFPKGAALADWLVSTGASTTRGQLPVVMAQSSLGLPVADATKVWLTTIDPTGPPLASGAPQLFTFYTPVEAAAAQQCGRVDFTDLHAATGTGSSSPAYPFPTACTAPASPSAQQLLWEFLFFDSPSCVVADGPAN
jgi:hypothetical protein